MVREHMKQYFPERYGDNGMTDKDKSLLKSMNRILKGDTRKTKCELMLVDMFQESAEIKLLMGAMKKFGCIFDMKRHLACEDCKNCYGGYDPDTNQIIVCKNVGLSKKRVFATVVHEMIHMFDFCRAKFDFDNLKHIACSEIRAANLTFCTPMTRLFWGGSGYFDLKKSHQYCVKEVAFQSVRAYSPGTPEEEVWNIVEEVFEGCYNDLEPFGRRPMNYSSNFRNSYRERYYFGYN